MNQTKNKKKKPNKKTYTFYALKTQIELPLMLTSFRLFSQEFTHEISTHHRINTYYSSDLKQRESERERESKKKERKI